MWLKIFHNRKVVTKWAPTSCKWRTGVIIPAGGVTTLPVSGRSPLCSGFEFIPGVILIISQQIVWILGGTWYLVASDSLGLQPYLRDLSTNLQRLLIIIITQLIAQLPGTMNHQVCQWLLSNFVSCVWTWTMPPDKVP